MALLMTPHPTSNQYTFGPEQHMFVHGEPEMARDVLQRIFDATPLESEHNLGEFETLSWYGDHWMISQSMMDSLAIRRTRAQSEFAAPLVFVHRYKYGHFRGVIGDVNIDRAPGSIYILDLERRVESLQVPILVQGFYIPKAMIGYDPDIHPPMIQFPVATPVGELINREFSQTIDQVLFNNTLNHSSLMRFASTLMVCIKTDQGRPWVRRNARQALAGLIRAHIDQDLRSPSLKIETIQRKFGISRATLFRLFERQGGVRTYIQDRRMFRAVMDIARRPQPRDIITEAAEKWGYSSTLDFNKSVQRAFGVSAQSLVGTAPEGYEFEPPPQLSNPL